MTAGAGALVPVLSVADMQIREYFFTTTRNPHRCICPAKNMIFAPNGGRRKGNHYERTETYGNRNYGGRNDGAA